MRLAIIGGSGTLGRELVKQVYPHMDTIVIYSRGEHKQAEMAQDYPEYPDNRIRYIIGDVKDRDTLRRALRGCDMAILAAAMKRIETCERHPAEAIAVNVQGALNFIAACNLAGVKKAIYTSSDKAPEPCGIYGGSKYLAERAIIQANQYGECRFSAVRYPNVTGSNGSVFHLWDKQYKAGEPLTVTDPYISRMWISIEHAARFVLDRLMEMHGGETYIPGERWWYREFITDIISNKYPDAKVKYIGYRCPEKKAEVLLTQTEERNTYAHKDFYIIYPECCHWPLTISGDRVPEGTYKRLRSDYREEELYEI